jgi:biotin operon repressor
VSRREKDEPAANLLSPVEQLGWMAIAIHRILGDGEWHTSTDLEEATGRSRRWVRETIRRLRDVGINIEGHNKLGYRRRQE